MAGNNTIQRALVAVDFSNDSLAAARLAVSVARAKGTEVALYTAVEQVEHISISPRIVEEIRRETTAQRNRQIDALAGELSETLGKPIETSVAYGEPVRGILGYAAEWNADLIAMGSHGADVEEQRRWLGSVAAHVARGAKCPVLTTRADQADRYPKHGVFAHVLVAVDYSKFSRPAAELATALAEPGSLIEMIHIYDAPQQSLAQARAEELQRLENFASQIDLAPISVSFKAELGRVASQLVDYAGNSPTDLVIVGAHGREDKAEYLGSVADRLLRSSPVPVILLPDTD